MALHDLGLGLLAFIAEILGTISGFGSSAIFVPAATFIESFHLVLALTAILHVISNTSKLMLFRGALSVRDSVVLAVPSIIFTGVGALLTSLLPVPLLQTSLGLVLMIIAVSQLLTKKGVPRAVSVFLTALSGFFTGLVGTGGAVRAAALRSMRLDKNAFVFVSSLIDFGGDAVRTGIYLQSGYMDWTQWYYIPILFGAAVAGSWIGRWVLEKVPQSAFEKLVTLLIFASGLSLMIKGISLTLLF